MNNKYEALKSINDIMLEFAIQDSSATDIADKIWNAVTTYETQVYNEAIDKASLCTRNKRTQLAILKLKK